MRNWQDRGLDEPPHNLSMIQIKTQERLEAHAQAHPYTAQRAKKEQIALEAHRIALEARQAHSEPQVPPHALEAQKQALEAQKQAKLARQLQQLSQPSPKMPKF